MTPPMNLLIRCLWMPASDASVASRLAEMADIGTHTRLLDEGCGPHWFQLGHSRRDALKHEIRLADLHTTPNICRRVALTEGEAYWTLDAWNGRPDEEGANLHFRLYDPPIDLDVFLISLERAALGETLQWNDVLSTARRLSEQLGAHVIVRSDSLLTYAAERNIAGAENSAYAAFWGVDRSGHNPLFQWFGSVGMEPPSEIVACDPGQRWLPWATAPGMRSHHRDPLTLSASRRSVEVGRAGLIAN